MSLPRLPRPEQCPDSVDWDALSPVAQHGLTACVEQLGCWNSDRDLEFIGRLHRPVRRAA